MTPEVDSTERLRKRVWSSWSRRVHCELYLRGGVWGCWQICCSVRNWCMSPPKKAVYQFLAEPTLMGSTQHRALHFCEGTNRGRRWEQKRPVWAEREGIAWTYMLLKLRLAQAQPNKKRTAEQRERGCQIWSRRIGSVSVPGQIKRECREKWASTRAGTPTGSHSLWEIAPLTQQHLPTILLSICWFTYQGAASRLCAYVLAPLHLCTCLPVVCVRLRLLIPWTRCLYQDR